MKCICPDCGKIIGSSTVKFRGKDYFDVQQIMDILLQENEDLKRRISEHEQTLNAFRIVADFIRSSTSNNYSCDNKAPDCQYHNSSYIL